MNPQGNLGNVAPDAMAALREAMTRRGMGDKMPALDTQSGASPTASPLPPQPTGSAPMPSVGEGLGASMGAEAGAGMPPAENQEARLIVGALKERLKAISTIEGGVPPKVPSGGMA